MSSWQSQEKIKAALLKRLSQLLGTDRPASILAFMVRRKSAEHPDIDLESDYSVLEDLVVQDIILKYRDVKLDLLWVHYNYGYFYEDTVTVLKKKLGDSYERFINCLADDPDAVSICEPNVLKA